MRNYLFEEINQNDLMSKTHKKVCRVLNYINHSLIVITGFFFSSAFASLINIPKICIPIGIARSTIGLKLNVITAGIKKYKSMNKKKGNKHDKIVLLSKSQLNGK